jgi:hypothetical protein
MISGIIASVNKVLARRGWTLAPYPTPPTYHNLWQYALYSELIRETRDVPGAIIECGVAFGRGVLVLLHAERTFGSGRKIYGFDTFAGYPKVSDVDNLAKDAVAAGTGVKTVEIRSGGLRWSRDQVMRFIRNSGLEKETIANLTLIEGDVADTLPKFDKTVALAILEMDLYQSTKDALTALRSKMSKGGIIVPLNYNNKFRAAGQALSEVLPNAKLETSKVDDTKVFIRF